MLSSQYTWSWRNELQKIIHRTTNSRILMHKKHKTTSFTITHETNTYEREIARREKKIDTENWTTRSTEIVYFLPTARCVTRSPDFHSARCIVTKALSTPPVKLCHIINGHSFGSVRKFHEHRNAGFPSHARALHHTLPPPRQHHKTSHRMPVHAYCASTHTNSFRMFLSHRIRPF